jgi:hypothetical protein
VQDYTISTHHTFILGLVNILLQFIFFIDKYLLNLSSNLNLRHTRFLNCMECYLLYSIILTWLARFFLIRKKFWYCLHVNTHLIRSKTIIAGYAFKSLEARTCMIKRGCGKQICENKGSLARKLRCYYSGISWKNANKTLYYILLHHEISLFT